MSEFHHWVNVVETKIKLGRFLKHKIDMFDLHLVNICHCTHKIDMFDLH